MYFIVTGLDYIPMYICHCPKRPMYYVLVCYYTNTLEVKYGSLSLVYSMLTKVALTV